MAQILLINPRGKRKPKTAGAIYVYKSSTGRRMRQNDYYGKAFVIEDGADIVSRHRTFSAAKKEQRRRQKLAGRDAFFIAYEFEKKLTERNPWKSGAKPKTAKKKTAPRAGLAKPRPVAKRNRAIAGTAPEIRKNSNPKTLILPPTRRALNLIFGHLTEKYFGMVFFIATNGRWQSYRKHPSMKKAVSGAAAFSQKAGVTVDNVRILKFAGFNDQYEPVAQNMNTQIIEIIPGEIWDKFLVNENRSKMSRRFKTKVVAS